MEWILHPGQLTKMLGMSPGEFEKINQPSVSSDSSQTTEINRVRFKRPHTKSRRGCLNCKRRKVKCQETKPECQNCLERNMKCTYFPSPGNNRYINAEVSADTGENSLSLQQPSTTAFSGDDLRVFQHFLLVSRPHLPFGSENSWTTLVPAYAHECPHLMEAILSLGATHYALLVPDNSRYRVMALSHRGKALEHLSSALDKIDNCTPAFLDGILATSYVLIFQAYYMSDGMIDFAIMVRGCSLITNKIKQRFNGSNMFLLQSPEQVTQLAYPWLSAEAHSNQEVIERLIIDIEKLRPYLNGGGTPAFFVSIQRTYIALQHSIRDAFACLTEIYLVWYSMDNQQFMDFVGTGNCVTRALFLHYIAIDTLMRPFLLNIGGPKHPTLAIGGMIMAQWANALHRGLPKSLQRMVEYETELIVRERGEMPSALTEDYDQTVFCQTKSDT